MKRAALLFAFFLSHHATAEELTTGKLLGYCNASDEVSQSTCRSYILGAVQGIILADGAKTEPSTGHIVNGKRTLLCLPDNIATSRLVEIFRIHVQPLLKAHPNTANVPAISVVGIAMTHQFPCTGTQ